MDRDWELLDRLSKLSDDVLIGVKEAAALTGFAEISIRQRRVTTFPSPLPGLRHLRWHIGQIRNWGTDCEAGLDMSSKSSSGLGEARRGRPRLPASGKGK